MSSDEVRPFLAAQRHDVLRDLVADRNALIQSRIMGVVGRGMDPTNPKIDGKGGALDGTPAIIRAGDINAYVPICGAYPGPKIEHPKGKDTKEGKESKDGKEGKEGKESKDSKEGAADGGKFGGSEVSNPNPATYLGDPSLLPSEAFNAIAEAFPGLVEAAVARGSVVF